MRRRISPRSRKPSIADEPFRLAGIVLALSATGNAWGACTTSGSPVTCDAANPNPWATPIGSGPSTPTGFTVTLKSGNSVTPGAQLSVGEASAISLNDGAVITLGDYTSVTNNANNQGARGLHNAGLNTIEFASNGQLTIGNGASVSAAGAQGIGEPINVMGVGNVITNHGTITSHSGAAIWFEDRVTGGTNIIDNFGIVRTDLGANTNIIGNSSNGSVIFTNRSGARVEGSLKFASGNDQLTLEAGSVITGNFDGGGGTNTLTLGGAAGFSDSLPGNISNFQTLTKTGAGTWTLTGSIGTDSGRVPLRVLVNQGTLALTGNNSSFNGSVTVNTNGTLAVRAQSLPPLVTDNGLVQFLQDTDGTYAGVLEGTGSVQKTLGGTLTLSGANTWSGPTIIQGGTLSVSTLANGGLASNIGSSTNEARNLVINGSTLRYTGAGNATDRLFSVGAAGGTIEASGTGALNFTNTGAVGFNATGARTLTLSGSSTGLNTLAATLGDNGGATTLAKSGTGKWVLTGNHNYTGGTTINAGTLQIGNGGTSGSITGNVVDNGLLAFNRTDDITFAGVISGTGGLVQAGTGTLTVTGGSSYTGVTTISSGTLQIGADAAAGTVSGNIVNNGALVYARSDTRSYGAVISGTGSVTQAGNGVLNLTGLNTYTGLTNVNSGVLAVNGTVGGGAQVNAGATLRGTGTLAGAVTVADGGHLAPGNSPGTLNVGSLALNGASQIDYELGFPGEVGGTQNDLTNVAGNLTLGGTLNLANLGGMSPGTYRVFNYGGTLTDNGLAINGQLPARFVSSDFLVDTATPGQVNLIVQSGGFALQYWDGVNTTANNLVDGGTSTWNTTTTNWTNAGGTVNAPWQSGFAVFQGAAGAVTLGQNISFQGMQFRTTGYTIEGAGFTLAGEPETFIRVDPSVSATINASIVDGAGGPARLISSDAGLLVLGGANTYSGGTAINGGSVQVSADNNLGAASGGLSLNKGTLISSATFGSARNIGLGSDGGTFAPMAGTTLSLTGPISGPGMLTQSGSGTLVLSGANSYAGGTFLANGVLAVASDANLGASGGPLEFGGGTLRTDADLSLATTRTVTFDAPGGRIDTNGHTATIVQTIGGSGGLTKLGSGTLVLAGNNAYEGGTTISAGTLQIGNGGAAGSFGAGDIANNGVIAFNRGDASAVSNAISGSGSLQQIGAGTTTLTGANSYTGGTTISNGTLQLGNGADTGSITGNVSVTNGTLAFNRNNLYTFEGLISGSGGVSQSGTGATVLSAANTYSGATTVAAGTLRAGAPNAFSPNSAYTVANGATLDTGGFNQRVASLDNSGTVSLLSAAAGSTLTVTGAYVAHSLLRLGTQLGGDGSVSDRLVLDGPGASASGNTTIQITNLGGLGALTTGNGIEVVSGTNGATTTAQTTKSAFTLANGHVDAGAYEYRLYAADAQGAGENWYLRSTTTVVPPNEPVAPVQVPTYRVEVPLLAALPAQLRQADLAMLGNLHRRIGDEAPSAPSASLQDNQAAAPGGTRRAWGRVVYADMDIQQPGVAQVRSDGHVAGLQAGTDLWASGNWRAGVYVGYLDGSADVSGNARGIVARVGYNELQSRYLGAYATWMDASGLYVDSVLQGGSQRFTIRPDINLGVGGKASSVAASVEVGMPFALNARWSLEPQAQIAFQRSSVDDMVLSGAQVRQDVASGWIGRLGLRIKGNFATAAGRLEPYARVNLYRASFGDSVATFIGPAGALAISSGGGYSAAEAAAGATLALNPATSLYGEIGHLWSIGGDATLKSAVQASLGIKVRW
ncbi:autotransporter-associated beta strand repeat-containing protein [Variovorax robiniae]|uniref:Autotransporter-associated beta strand repeat-containing protein n=1 Tax=Variovorax robiniae TaxID=1836199 RepID=A0ABU8XLH1_9BURK